MSLFLWIVVLVSSLAVLIFSAGRFTKSAEKLGLILGIPSFIVGVTIVSIGTSLPELMTSLLAVFKSTPAMDTTPIVIGNAVGSNIANVLLIIGITALLVRKLEVKRSLIELDIPLLLLSTALLVVVAYDGQINWIEGIILLFALGVYLRYAMSDHAREKIEMEEEVEKIRRPIWRIFRRRKTEAQFEGKIILSLIVFSILIYVGARYTIESLVNISEIVGIGTSILAASAIAIGTSLPELFVSGAAALRGNHDIAMGNVFGSNIFNALFVVGIPALVKPLTVPPEVLTIGIPFLIGATVVYVFSAISRKIYTYEGIIYLLLYIVFIAKLFEVF